MPSTTRRSATLQGLDRRDWKVLRSLPKLVVTFFLGDSDCCDSDVLLFVYFVLFPLCYCSIMSLLNRIEIQHKCSVFRLCDWMSNDASQNRS